MECLGGLIVAAVQCGPNGDIFCNAQDRLQSREMPNQMDILL